MDEFKKQNKLSDKIFTQLHRGLTCAMTGIIILFYCQPNQTPEKIQKTKIEQLSDKNNEIFSYFKEGMNLEERLIKDQEGREIYAKILVEESVNGEEAQRYIEELAENAYILRNENGYPLLESKIDLAKDIISTAREYIQREDYNWKGNGHYTLGYEYDPQREKLKKELMDSDFPEEIKSKQWYYLTNAEFEGSDSVQTFDEFFGPKGGTILLGDCDDFSMALTTIYHGLKDYAEANKNRDSFFEALAEGLDYYRIATITVFGHALNLSATLGKNTSFEVIEPQDRSRKMTLEMIDGNAYTKELNDKGEPVVNRILYMYNRDFSAEAKKQEPNLQKN